MIEPDEPQRDDESTDVTVDDRDAALLGFGVIGAIVWFTVVWNKLPAGGVRWAITGAVVAAIVAVRIAAGRSDKLAAWFRRCGVAVQRWGGVWSDFLVFALVVAAILLAAIYLAADDKVMLLKLLTVVYFALLPAVLYLQFDSRKKLTVWREYVLNLYRLDIDDPGSLPRPPALSPFYPAWRRAREDAWQQVLETENDGDTRAAVDQRLEHTNLYRQKFRDLFGPVPKVDEDVNLLSLHSSHKLQVVVATILITVGWVFVVDPETVFHHTFAPGDFKLLHLPRIPEVTFAFAFLGAYFYILQMLVRRYFQSDLKSTAYLNATMRITIVILLVWVIDPLLIDRGVGQPTRSAVAFAIGVFPNVGWRLIQLSVRKPIGLVVDSLEPRHKLGDIDGLNVWYESRLLEVGVEDMENLATTDIVDLMLNTRIPVDRMIDWIDQAFLYLRVEDTKDSKPRGRLRSYGVRNATDLLDLMASDVAADYAGILDADGGPSRMRALAATLKRERNLRHVLAWKEYSATRGVPVEEEPPPEAVPAPVV